MELIDTEVAVVGAGPAGLAAAVASAQAGARTTLLDENQLIGGQIWRQQAGLPGGRHNRDLSAAEARIRSLGVSVASRSTVWAAEPGSLLLERAVPGERSAAARVRYSALVIATGAHDRAVPFPGWTLPGVWTAGGLQALAKAHRVVPGQRIVLVGAGPFLLPVAATLIDCGAHIVTVVEASAVGALARDAHLLARYPARGAELVSYLRKLVAARVPVRTGAVIVCAKGEDRVRSVVIADVDSRWSPKPGSEREIDADTVGIGYGFVPQIQLAQLLGCVLRREPGELHDVVVHGPDMQTTQTGVFVAGEITGIGGSKLADAEGQLAGAGAARHAGYAASTPRHVLSTLRRERTFAAALRRRSAPRPGLWELAEPSTMLCRCEDVPLAEIAAAIAAGSASADALKLATRVGMGPCQGRMCAGAVAGMLIGHGVKDAAARFSTRPPIKPVALSTLIEADGRDLAGDDP